MSTTAPAHITPLPDVGDLPDAIRRKVMLLPKDTWTEADWQDTLFAQRIISRIRRFDPRYHATRNRGACARDTRHPCAICGWAEHMAIHEEGSFHVSGYGHVYKPNAQR